MLNRRVVTATVMAASVLALSGCSGGLGLGNLFGSRPQAADVDPLSAERPQRTTNRAPQQQSSIRDLFADRDDPNTTLEVNKYIWNAALDVLNFMPIQTVDPFSGVIVFGYGTPPGGGRAYRATVHVSDPALDARSLHVSLQSRGGQSVSTETRHAIEDAILGRARQLRMQDYEL